MKLNCKPGDLAVIVKSCCGNEGKILRVIKLSHHKGLTDPDGSVEFGVVWHVEGSARSWDGAFHGLALDRRLRPIRDPGEDAQDETLQWLDVPRKVAA